ncbi:hypothetical protein [Deinococcus aerophilus]|uniref:Uncharacterized protein n=1 Tax=Deinococcus aerophilus TaxID=522488 RepID=A0ABQ2GZW0_9DEIO|nr:hypothetical protein [Deinococcus aerophilus]GGM22183.1 hypothetical protein GCM10010841_32570 [Deinococcus aerophilus]
MENSAPAVLPRSLELATLAALMLAGGDLTTDELIEVIRDGKPREMRAAAQRVSRVVRQLRVALGWDGSVLSLGGAYLLDPAVNWSSNVHAALHGHAQVTAFLSGISWRPDRFYEIGRKTSCQPTSRVV